MITSTFKNNGTKIFGQNILGRIYIYIYNFFFAILQTTTLAINNSNIDLKNQINTYKPDQAENKTLKHDVVNYNKNDRYQDVWKYSMTQKTRNF